MLCHFHGKYRSVRESCFLEQVKEELGHFQSICCQESILVFPPLACQYRFLIHKCVEADPKLASVSVGQRGHRRTAVYFASERELHRMASPLRGNPRTFAGRGRGRRKDFSDESALERGKTCQEQSIRRTRRPDQTFYVPGALNQERQKQDRDKNRQIGRISRNREDIYGDSSIRSGEKGSDEKINQSVTLKNSYNNLQQYRFASDIGSPDRKSNSSSSNDVSTTEHLPVSSSVEELEQCVSNQLLSKVITDKEDFNKSGTVKHLTFNNSSNMTSNIPSTELQDAIYNSMKLQSEELRTASGSDHLSLGLVEDDLCKHGQNVEQNKSWLTAEPEKGLPPRQGEDEEFSNQNKNVNSKLKVSSDNSNLLEDAVIHLVNITNKKNVGSVGCHHNMGERNVPDSPKVNTATNWSHNYTAVDASHETRLEFVITEQGEESCGLCVKSENELQVKAAGVMKPLNCILGERTDKTLLLAPERDQDLRNDILDDSIKKPFDGDLDADVAEHKAITNATASFDKSDSFIEMRIHSFVSDESKECTNKCLERNKDVPQQVTNDSGDVRENSLPGDSVSKGYNRAIVSVRSAFKDMEVEDKQPSEEEHDTNMAFQFSDGISEAYQLSLNVTQTTEEFVKSTSDVKGLLSQPCGIVSDSFGATLVVGSQVMEEPNNDLVGNPPPLAGTVIERPQQNVSSPRCITEVMNGYGESKVKKASSETEGEKHSYSEEQTENKVENGQSDTLFSQENANDCSIESGKPSRTKPGKIEADKPSRFKTKSKEKAEKKKRKTKGSIKDSNLDRAGIKKETLHAKRECSTQAKKKEEVSPEFNSNHESRTTHAMCEPVCGGNDDDDDDDNGWEANFDESGECINPELLAELSKVTGITTPTIHKPQYDYYSWLEPKGIELDDEEFGHIVEIYNFSADLTTQDLLQALCAFSTKGFDIKWVDDTHALGIFSSHLAAQEAIRLCSSPLMKLRPVSEGTLQSKKKATQCFEFLLPYKERPKTCKLLADRLVTGALGMRSKISREERVKEREKIKEAKEKKRQERLQKAEIWGD